MVELLVRANDTRSSRLPPSRGSHEGAVALCEDCGKTQSCGDQRARGGV